MGIQIFNNIIIKITTKLMLSDDFGVKSFAEINSRQNSHCASSAEPSALQNYVDQFLNEEFFSENSCSKNAKSHNSLMEPPKQSEDHLQPVRGRQKSQFHNYQKHLIITLRNNINLQNQLDLSKLTLAASQLWKRFKSLRTYNKSLLRVLFGEEGFERCLNTHIFEKEKFSQLLVHHSEEELLAAQNELRLQVVDFFKAANLHAILRARNIPEERKLCFCSYMSEFLVELSEGKVAKRLPKKRKEAFLS